MVFEIKLNYNFCVYQRKTIKNIIANPASGIRIVKKDGIIFTILTFVLKLLNIILV